MPATVYSNEDSAQVAISVGKYILKQQSKAIEANGSFKIAVSGGSLGKVLKKALIDDENVKDQVQWNKWEIFFSDERLVPLTHDDSNYGLFNQNVLQHLKDSNKPKVYTINESKLTGENGQVEGSSQEQDEEIAKEYATTLPSKIDTILLGCGPDGHTASLFPGHALLKETSKSIAFISDSPKPPPRRITFTFPVLEKAGSIAFVAEGADKAPILKKIFNDSTSRLPSQLVNELDTEVNWFVNANTLTGVDVIVSKY